MRKIETSKRIQSIDGLRAFAVIAVVLYHLKATGFSNGYLGVDAFFTISGFVITSLLVNEFDNENKINYPKFFRRRFLRLAPSLMLTTIIFLPICFLWLSPTDYQNFLKQLPPVAFFSGNIYFWKQINYFNESSFQPFLHTWSLGVEEQFYLLFPFFLALLLRRFRIKVTQIIIFCISVSLISGFVFQDHQMAIFYLLPFRLWELLLGCFFYFLASRTVKRSETYSEVFSIIGIGLIILGALRVNPTGTLPNVGSIAVCIGVGMLMMTPSSIFAKKVLQQKNIVKLGLRSYTYYLLHYPLIGLMVYRYEFTNNSYEKILVIAILLVTSELVYRYWETPWRQTGLSNRNLGIVYFCAMSAIAMASIFTYLNSSEKIDSEKSYVLSFADPANLRIDLAGSCFIDLGQPFTEFPKICDPKNHVKSLVIMGDSHAATLSEGFRQLNFNFGAYTSSSCPPFVGIPRSDRPNCLNVNDAAIARIALLNPEKVILLADWVGYGYSENEFEGMLQKTIEEILKVSPNSKVYLLGGLPRWVPNLPYTLIKNHIPLENFSYVRNTQTKLVSKYDSLIKVVAQQTGAKFIDTSSILCRIDSKCVGYVPSVSGVTEPFAFDYAHLTPGGSLYLVGKLTNLLK